MAKFASNSTHADELGMSPQVTASLTACECIVRSRARNFWFGLRMTPRPRRDALYVLYAWMRLGDDLVDEPAPKQEARARFELFASTSRRLLDGDKSPELLSTIPHQSASECWPGFVWLIREFPVQRVWLEAMLAGLESDLAHAPPQTQQELDLYRYRVASTVGMCCTAIWGLRPGVDASEAFALADIRGRAFQMVNIVRDIGQDARDASRRVYIPAEAMSRYQLSIDDLLAWRNPKACDALVRDFVAIARAEFRESSELCRLIAPDCVRVLGAMTAIYEGVLARLERTPRLCIAEPAASLPTWRKAWIAAKWSLRGANP